MKPAEPIVRIVAAFAVMIGVSDVTGDLWSVGLIRAVVRTLGIALVSAFRLAHPGQGALVLLAIISIASLVGGLVLIALKRGRSREPGRRGSAPVAVVAATALIVVGVGGGATAASKIGSAQIKDNSVRSTDVRNGTLQLSDLSTAARNALRLEAGPQVFDMSGSVPSLPGNTNLYVFAGPTVVVKTTGSRSRISGVVTGSFAVAANGSPESAQVGLCYRSVSGGYTMNLVGTDYTTQRFTLERQSFTAAASSIMVPGTYQVGMCVLNGGPFPISNNSFVNGWVQVTG